MSDWVYACLERNKFIGETEGCGELPSECTVVTAHVIIKFETILTNLSVSPSTVLCHQARLSKSPSVGY